LLFRALPGWFAKLLDHRLVLTGAIPLGQGCIHYFAAVEILVPLEIQVDGTK